MLRSAFIIIFTSLLLMTAAASEDRVNSLFIESLRNEKFAGGELKVEKLVGEKEGYKSYLVSYDSDGLKQFALMNVPKSKVKGQKFPVVVVNHGYIPPDQYSTVRSYRLVTGYFAAKGFLTIKPDYRGHGNSEGERSLSPFHRVNYARDVIHLLNALDSVDEADLENIFMYGHSMGGDVTLRVLEVTDRVRAATLWAAVTARFPESTLYFVRKRDKGLADQLKEWVDELLEGDDYKKLSPIDNLGYVKVPLIIHHGTDDDSVPYKWGEELSRELKKAGVDHKFYSYKDDHNFARNYFYTVLARDAAFFKEKMKR